MRVLTVIGARPQFVKAAPLSHALRQKHDEFLVHTGQHYDQNMSEIFFQELGIPEPDANLGVGSGSHAVQTASMMPLLSKCIENYQPDIVLVYGDTNSTLAAAVVVSKMTVPLGHIEAGLRSYNRTMPEEVNRVLTDHVSELLFCPSDISVANLRKEGIEKGVHQTGDVMVDAIKQNIVRAQERSTILDDLGLNSGTGYGVMTIHRPANTDNPQHMAEIIASVDQLDMEVIFPIHPRTRKSLETLDLTIPSQLRLIDPVGYLSMLRLVESASLVVTDSGGLQKEAYVLQSPTITVRPETEWVETVENGWNNLVDPDREAIRRAIQNATNNIPADCPDVYGDGHAAEHIVNALEQYIGA